MEDKIKQYFKDKMSSPSKLVKAIKNASDEIKQYLENRLKQIPEYQTLARLVCAIVNDIKLTNCPTCGKKLLYHNVKDGKIYCSNKCAQRNLDIKQKIKSTCLNRYGVKAPTCNEEVLKKRRENNLKKYGYQNTLSVPQIRQSIKKTCNKKYGGNAPACSQQIRNKMSETLYQKAGVDSNSLIKGYQHILTFNQFVIPLFLLNEYKGFKDRTVYKWKCVKCGLEFQSSLPFASYFQVPQWCPRCPNCYPENVGISQSEKQVVQFIKTIYSGQIIQNDRQLIKPYQLDIVLPQLRVAIQFNGVYWHSDKIKNSNYHLMKTQKCLQEGYKLIHIFDYEWINKQQIIKQKLKSIICNDLSSVYARKCQIKQIDNKTKNQFLNRYHIQGVDNSSVRIGLYNQNQLVAVMTFCKPRFTKKYQWQLSRYATSKRVIGGAGKLLKYFKDHYNPKSIITYCDRRFSTGNMYEKIGFKLDHISQPNYKWNKNSHILSRYGCQKHKLKQLLKQNYKQQLSQKQNMQNNGYSKIYDCGNLVYIIN